MLIFLGKYVYALVLCIPMLLDSNCGNKQLMATSRAEDLQVYRTSACTAKCLLSSDEGDFQNCYDVCSVRSESEPKNQSDNKLNWIHENFNLKLVCRDDRSLTFKIETNPPMDNGSNSNNNNNGISSNSEKLHLSKKTIKDVYVIKVVLAEEHFIYLSDEHFFTIGDLKHNTTYNISAVVVHSTDEYSVIAKSRPYSTLRRGYKPDEIQDISMSKFKVDETNEMRLQASIDWIPSSDLTCHYDIIYYSTHSEDFELTPIELRNPHDLFSYTLKNLTFSTYYKVGIRAKNTNNTSKESDLYWMSFRTPACMEWHSFNFTLCAPAMPEGLHLEQKFIAGNNFSLNVSWDRPNEYLPDYYTLRVLDLNQFRTEGANLYILNVTKDQNYIFIPMITIYGTMYEVHLTAYTAGGNTTAICTEPTAMRIVTTDKVYIFKLIAAILAPTFCIPILLLTIFFICHRRAKFQRYQQRCRYFEDLEKKAPIDPKSTLVYPTKKLLPLPTSPEILTHLQLDLEEKLVFNDALEINRDNVTLYEVLGEGAFGLVRRGIYKDEKLNLREVAVKMLKDRPSADDVRAFRQEIEVMKSVGKHPNIVGIIGHCTKQYNEMLLITEYCSFGNLLNFLRDEWKYLHELSFQPMKPPPLPIFGSPSAIAPNSVKQCKYMENVFNFDTSIIDKKIKPLYKNMNSTPNNNNNNGENIIRATVGATDYSKAVKSLYDQPRTEVAKPCSDLCPPLLVRFNKSYGYADETCTSSCKCQVDVVAVADSSDAETKTDQLDQLEASVCKVQISNCECQTNRLRSVENKGYYKNFTEAPSPINTSKSEPMKSEQKDGISTTPPSAAGFSDRLASLAKRQPLQAADLLEIAKQVAIGMEFLAKNKVVHRDLAARNVLVSPDRTVKIADFGLSRDVYQENVYKKTGNGKLPIKWLALESMTHQVYTSQSDVWSYGILLYEITTLGGIPYPSIPTNRLLNLLKTGYRMEKPKNCGEELYNLMTSCWSINPGERPNFGEITKILDGLLGDSPQKQIGNLLLPTLQIGLNVPPLAESENDSYLKPL